MSKSKRWLGAAVVTWFVVACGGSTVAVAPPSDGGGDGRGPADGMTTGDTAGEDSAVLDTGEGSDTEEPPDSSEPADTGPIDSGAADTGLDTGVDSEVDTGVDSALDSAVPDVGRDTEPLDTGTMPDTQPIDTGLLDSGSPPMDSGLPDSERFDTGLPGDTGTTMDSGMPGDSSPSDTGRADDTGVRDANGNGDAPSCPATVPMGACSDIGQTCSYPAEICYCSQGAPIMTTATWHCFVLPPACPQPEPAVGSACTTNDQMCNYGACEGGNELICMGGTWQVEMVFCPP